jgi:hypothetical protein
VRLASSFPESCQSARNIANPDVFEMVVIDSLRNPASRMVLLSEDSQAHLLGRQITTKQRYMLAQFKFKFPAFKFEVICMVGLHGCMAWQLKRQKR